MTDQPWQQAPGSPLRIKFFEILENNSNRRVLLTDLEEAAKDEQKGMLKRLLEHGHGGGNWQRLIRQQLSLLNADERELYNPERAKLGKEQGHEEQ